MNEKAKLVEAKYFYSMMIKEQNNKDNFIHNLSAFLSSSRSIMQYAREEARKIKGGQKWFDDWSKRPVLNYFKGKRDINIHTKPISPVAEYKVELSERVSIVDFISVILRDKNGKILSQHSSEPSIELETSGGDSQVKSEVKYTFDDWSSGEDVLALSQKYLQELEAFINDGTSKKVIID